MDHPRRCGENLEYEVAIETGEGSPPQVRGKLFASNYILHHMGSPPQVRGKPFDLGRLDVGDRITPAGAGKTYGRSQKGQSVWDHPRRCGENKRSLTVWKAKDGSPPQVRGKPAHAGKQTRHIGITPAGAGKTNILETKTH